MTRKRGWVFLFCSILAVWSGSAACASVKGEEEKTAEQTNGEASGTEPAAVIGNGSEMIQVQGGLYYMRNGVLCSDGERLYCSSERDAEHIYSWELGEESFSPVLDGRLVGCGDIGTVLYYVAGQGDTLWAYDTKTGESEQIFENLDDNLYASYYGRGCVGQDDEYLYVRRKIADGFWTVDEVQRGNYGYRKQENIMNHVFSEPCFGTFYADDEYILFAAGELQGSMNNFVGYFYSYNKTDDTLIRKSLTDSSGFLVRDGWVYYQKESAGKGEYGLYRTDRDFTENMVVGEDLELLSAEGLQEGILAARDAERAAGYVSDLVLLASDGTVERTLVDIHELMNTEAWKERFSEIESYDKIQYRRIYVIEDIAYVQFYDSGQGWRGWDFAEKNCWLKVHMDGSGCEFFQMPEELQSLEKTIH